MSINNDCRSLSYYNDLITKKQEDNLELYYQIKTHKTLHDEEYYEYIDEYLKESYKNHDDKYDLLFRFLHNSNKKGTNLNLLEVDFII